MFWQVLPAQHLCYPHMRDWYLPDGGPESR